MSFSTTPSLIQSCIFSFSCQIVFEGIVGASYQGDIAIDDIQLLDGNCNSKSKTPSNLEVKHTKSSANNFNHAHPLMIKDIGIN